jgi:hypothetical protein
VTPPAQRYTHLFVKRKRSDDASFAPDDDKLKRQLTVSRRPSATCCSAEYVAGKSDRGRSSSGGELDDRPSKRQCVMQNAKTSKEEWFRVLDKAFKGHV